MYPTLNSPIGSAFFSNLLANVSAVRPTTGRVFFVAKSGITNEQEIKATYGSVNYPDGTPILHQSLTLALAQTVASRGDTIIMAPGHTETVVGAAGIAVATAGVMIVGLGSGTMTPTVTFTTAIAASLDVTAANVLVKNVIFTCGIDAQTAMVNVTATDVSFLGCTFNTNSGTVGAVLGLFFNTTADRYLVDGCRFLGPATNAGTTTTAQIKYEASVDGVVQNSYFTGKMTQAILNTATVLRGLITNNNFVIATGTKAIAVAAASTPFISNNRINVPSGTAPVVAAAGFVAGNAYSAAAGVTAGTALTW